MEPDIRMASRLWLQVAIVGSLLTWFVPGVHATAMQRLALVGMDERLERAVETAVEPWGVAVIPLELSALGTDMSVSSRQAHGIARANTAGAVVWIAGAGDDIALWLYDVATEKVVVVPLASPPPYDEPTAAGVALTIKTLLRHSAVVPDTERLSVPEPARRIHVPRLAFSLHTGMRMRDTGRTRWEPRIGVMATWFPSSTAGRLGATAGFRAGLGQSLEESGFVGHYTDTTLVLGLRARLKINQRTALRASLGGALHLTRVDGAPVNSTVVVHEARVNPAVSGGLGMRVRWPSGLVLGADVEGSLMARRQRYLLGTVPVLALPVLELEVSVSLAFEIE